MGRSETERFRSGDKPPYPMNPQKHQQGLLRLELIRVWRVVDALLEGWTENSHALTEKYQRLAEEINQYHETVRTRMSG